MLQVQGYDTEVFDNVESFLKSAHLAKATCLVLDVQLQHMSGIELKGQLVQSGHPLPVVFITAADGEVIRQSALDAGCLAYLRKPFPSSLLIEAVETAIRNEGER